MKKTQKTSIMALMMAVSMTMGTTAYAAEKPANVTNVTATATSDNTIDVSWDMVEDTETLIVERYRIYYGPESPQQFQSPSYEMTIDTADANNSYELSNLEENTEYFVAVTAISTINGEETESGEYSIEASATTSTNGQSSENAETSEANESETNNADTTAPTVLNVLAADKNSVLIGFSEAIDPDSVNTNAFTISEQINENNLLEITSAKAYDQDITGKTVILKTGDQTKNTGYLLTASSNIKDTSGNSIISADGDGGLFIGSVLDSSTVSENNLHQSADDEDDQTDIDQAANDLLNSNTETQSTETETGTQEDVEQNNEVEEENNNTIDTSAPEEANNFNLSFKEVAEKFTVMMQWEKSLDSAEDLVNYILYQSNDGENFNQIASLGADITTYELENLDGEQSLTYKITAEDDKGNESMGVIGSVSLPKTGLATGFLVITSAAGANHILKRRRQKLAKKN